MENYNIKIEIENEITDAINYVIDEYINGRTVNTKLPTNILKKDDYDKYFNNDKKTLKGTLTKFKKNIKQLIKDIKWTGFNTLSKISNEPEKEYKELVTKILTDVIKDRTAYEKDNKIIKTFEQYNSLIYNISGNRQKKMKKL